jgi:hypothetical protein
MFILGDIMLSAREALLKIQAVLEVSENYLTNGGLELSATELDFIKDTLSDGLDNTNA